MTRYFQLPNRMLLNYQMHLRHLFQVYRKRIDQMMILLMALTVLRMHRWMVKHRMHFLMMELRTLRFALEHRTPIHSTWMLSVLLFQTLMV
jgi:hypothetical protein